MYDKFFQYPYACKLRIPISVMDTLPGSPKLVNIGYRELHPSDIAS